MISIKVINNLVYAETAIAATKFTGYSDAELSKYTKLAVEDPVAFKAWLDKENRSKIAHIKYPIKLLQAIEEVNYSKLNRKQHQQLKQYRFKQFRDDSLATEILADIKKCSNISIYNKLLQSEYQPNKTSLYIDRVNLNPDNIAYIIKQLDMPDYSYFTYADAPSELKNDLWMVFSPKKPLSLDPNNTMSVSDIEIYIKLDVDDAKNKIYVMSIHGQVENMLMRKLRKEGKAKENIFNSSSIKNLAITIRNSGKLYDLNLGYIEITHADTDDIQGLFTLKLSTFNVPITIHIDKNFRKYNLSDVYDILECIKHNFDLFDVVTGDVDADSVRIYFGGDIITLICNSYDGQEFEYWTHKPYEKGLPYMISNFAMDLHLIATL